MVGDKNRFKSHFVDMTDNPPRVFAEVLDYWQTKRGNAFAPAWTDINLMELPSKFLPFCIVVDFDGSTGPIRYRYYGSAIATLHGYELSNRTIDDMQPPDFRAQVIKQYRMIQERRMPMYFAAHYPSLVGRRSHQHLLRLPLSNDGKTVTNVLSVQDVSDESRELSNYFMQMKDSSAAEPTDD